jgi:transposase
MIAPNKRQAIYCLSNEGLSIREIARRLKVSRNTVRLIIAQKGDVADSSRADRITIDPELLQSLYDRCNGWVERVHEILKKEKGIDIGYSTLTRLFRELGLGPHKKQRCMSIPDQPGEEMQHDTSLYLLKIGDKSTRVIGSILYFRYSKIRYLKFYRSFDRFKMKCFFHEALIFFGYTAGSCIIDNTNLARLRGTGKYAVMAPEMEQFAQQYGFKFVCHEIGHANRKAGNERSFYTVETNFFPGRTFESMQD